MDPILWRRVKTVLDLLAESPRAQHPSIIDRQCGDDVDLRQAVLSYAVLEDRVDDFIDEPLWEVLPKATSTSGAASDAATGLDEPSDAELTQRVGPYQLQRLLGRGGMGEVYLAVRQDDYTQQVALKRTLGALQRDEILERFRTERQILANLQHPGIARLLDGGTDDDDNPYLVMEYVDGEPIDDYCDHHELTLEQRLRLVRKICKIVHHAHKNLIVHRDLKPSNILVMADGQPRLLDFGIAKLLEPSLDVAATAVDRAVMTVSCASPEQIMGDPITTACDVYALGVLLYRLLTGRQPYNLQGLPFSGVRKAICLKEVQRPSEVVFPDVSKAFAESSVFTLPIRLQNTATQEPTTAISKDDRRLRKRLEGDLDAIVMKAMRKEPEHRYTSAAELAEDIRRHLDGEPVQALRGNWLYHAKKYVRRNKAAVAVLSLIVALAVTSTTLGLQAEAARQSAVAAEAEAVSLRDFMIDILKSADPNSAQGRDRTVREVVEEALPRIEESLGGRPELQAQMYDTLGGVFTELGAYSLALEAHREALRKERTFDPTPRDRLAELIANIGSTHYYLRDLPAAAEAYREAYALRLQLHSDPLATAGTLLNLTNVLSKLPNPGEDAGAAIEQNYLRVLEIRQRHGAEAAMVAGSHYSLGAWYSKRGQYELAIPHLEQGLALRRQLDDGAHSQTASVMKSLARVLHATGDWQRAEILYEESLAMRQKLFGDSDARVGSLQEDLARLKLDLGAHDQGAYDQAKALILSALEISQSRGEKDSRHLTTRGLWGAYLLTQGKEIEGEDLLSTGYQAMLELYGADAFATQWTAQRLPSRGTPP